MREEHVVLLVILCGSLAFLGVLIFQYLMVIAIICIVIIILLLSEFRKWVESLVEKIAAAGRQQAPEVTGLNGAVASLREDVASIERRLDALERGEME